jgi:antitoxin component of RelBE/YafQ-DinJ toxin-antitoxin module
MTKTRISATIDPDIEKAARKKSKETGVPVSTAIERLLAWWIETGELPANTDSFKAKGEKKPTAKK